MQRIIVTILAGALMTTGAFAEGQIGQRKDNQQKRISNGVANGSLTPRETARVERKESRLNKEIHTDRKANGGNLTNNEKAQVHRQQNRLSKDIYNQKHDAQTQK